jgi:hypothetical protein
MKQLANNRLSFLQAPSSRSGLGCNREQLQLLLTHHQIMPSALDFVFGFRTREKPLAQAIFRHENYLERDGPAFSLPALGRSSTLVQHAFNILSVELSEVPGEKQLWPLRQTALYHSFDVQNGRALWMVLKGSPSMRRRIPNAVKNHGDLQPSAMNSPERSFVGSLHIHLIVLEWCAENWSEYIDHLEEMRSTKSIDAKVAPVAAMTSPLQIEQKFSRRTTMLTTASRQNTLGRDSGSRKSPSSPPSPVASKLARSLSDFLRRGSGFPSVASRGNTQEEEPVQQKDQDNEEGMAALLETKFSFNEFQRLGLFVDELEQAITAIEQNKGVICEVREQYDNVIASYGFKTHMKADECSSGVATFFRRLRSIDRELDLHNCRLRTLLRAVENDKYMVRFPRRTTIPLYATNGTFSLMRCSSIGVPKHPSISLQVHTCRLTAWRPGLPKCTPSQ